MNLEKFLIVSSKVIANIFFKFYYTLNIFLLYFITNHILYIYLRFIIIHICNFLLQSHLQSQNYKAL